MQLTYRLHTDRYELDLPDTITLAELLQELPPLLRRSHAELLPPAQWWNELANLLLDELADQRPTLDLGELDSWCQPDHRSAHRLACQPERLGPDLRPLRRSRPVPAAKPAPVAAAQTITPSTAPAAGVTGPSPVPVAPWLHYWGPLLGQFAVSWLLEAFKSVCYAWWLWWLKRQS